MLNFVTMKFVLKTNRFLIDHHKVAGKPISIGRVTYDPLPLLLNFLKAHDCSHAFHCDAELRTHFSYRLPLFHHSGPNFLSKFLAEHFLTDEHWIPRKRRQVSVGLWWLLSIFTLSVHPFFLAHFPLCFLCICCDNPLQLALRVISTEIIRRPRRWISKDFSLRAQPSV